MLRTRLKYVALAIATIAIGLFVHTTAATLPPALRDILGDALWAMMVFLALAFLLAILVTVKLGQRDGLPLLRLVSDAYGAQHPGVRQIRSVQSVAVHLMGLCTVLERGAHAEPRIIPSRDRRPPAPARLDLHWLEPPRPIGTLTVRGPVEATGGQEHAALVEAWARDVWAAWAAHHATVRDWVDRAAPARF